MTGAQAPDFAVVVRATILVRAQDSQIASARVGGKSAAMGWARRLRRERCRGLEERAWPVRVDRRRPVGLSQRHPWGADAPTKRDGRGEHADLRMAPGRWL